MHAHLFKRQKAQCAYIKIRIEENTAITTEGLKHTCNADLMKSIKSTVNELFK